MVELPHAGFTGTMWDAVPAEQLARELMTGPGVVPMAEAGLAYAALALGLGEAGAEYRAILAIVGNAWGSDSSAEGIAQLAQLADWFDDITTAAQHNAATAAEQAAAYEIAQLTMPHVDEVAAAVRMAEEMVSGTLLGAPLAGLFDTADHQVDALRDHAAQVMRTYEAGSDKLSAAWEQEAAPAVSAGAALLAEQKQTSKPVVDGSSGPPPDSQAVSPPALQFSSVVDLSALTVAPTPTLMVGGESLVFTPIPQPVAPIVAATAGAPVVATAAQVPPPSMLAPPTNSPVPVSPQAGQRAVAAEAGALGEQIVVQAGFATAPPVLGGVAQSRTAGASQ
ncbi:PPE domain-containing protein [Nocardia amamiensis]|uniref:PPE domain-containing protein n=1 Tax=Nocardia amamiensis TaxID=404578 RepID=A0ABS0D0Q4_9NOCA|nr:PPE domain-containing protein [Nocardia amamiensis]MBF6302416.1 PPE domain-containing protein [Nocardia amamiensis]